MAELATIARPYAEALYKAAGSGNADLSALAADVRSLARIAADPQLRAFADNPKTSREQVVELIASVMPKPTSDAATNLARTVVENGRIAVLGEIATQFQALVDEQTGSAQAVVQSAFPLDDAQLASVAEAMQKRFGRKLETTVEVDPSLIGGVRVVVGDEVLDTSIRARLEQMKAALVA